LGAVETASPTALRDLTTLRLGGPAGRLVEARDEAAVVEGVRSADRAGEPLLVLAGGSNVVVADDGFPGTVLRIATRGIAPSEGGDGRVRLEVQAGEPWDPLVARCVSDGLAGVECLSGIPGSVGATPIQNVGAYGQEVAETVRSVRALDRARDAVVELPAAECGFSYRSSAFKRTPGRWVVLAVTFELERSARSAPVRYAELARRLGVPLGERAPLGAVREAVLELRRGKGMLLDPADHDTWSAGSFFTNPVLDAAAAARLPEGAPRWPVPGDLVKTSAAWLIEHAGFAKGHGNGRVALSGKHPLALTNRGGASTADLLALALEVRDGVELRFGIRLVNEPVLLGCSL
jgi:UDP-N-acetylmuramate dehydrogenase